MSDDIEVRELTTLSVSQDGSAFRMGIRDAAGLHTGLIFPTDAVKTLMIRLFKVGDTAFRRLLDDDGARHVFPATSCKLQSVPGSDRLILVVQTSDGFDVAFAIEPQALINLASAALDHADAKTARQRAVN